MSQNALRVRGKILPEASQLVAGRLQYSAYYTWPKSSTNRPGWEGEVFRSRPLSQTSQSISEVSDCTTGLVASLQGKACPPDCASCSSSGRILPTPVMSCGKHARQANIRFWPSRRKSLCSAARLTAQAHTPTRSFSPEPLTAFQTEVATTAEATPGIPACAQPSSSDSRTHP